jgi:hypothetical protein
MNVIDAYTFEAFTSSRDGFSYSNFIPLQNVSEIIDLYTILSNRQYFWIDHRVNSADGTIAKKNAALRRLTDYLARARAKRDL